MKRRKLFTRVYKEIPSDEESKNAKLLIRAGYIYKEMAGVYDFLPLGYKTLHKIINIIREEMNKIGGQEIQMSALQNKELWEKTGRWDDEKVDVWFKTNLQVGGELGLGFTHEEPITNMMKRFISSYKDLPVLLYQFQRKFRNEVRAKSGIMRTREFIMKDLYSFAKTKEEQEEIYEEVTKAYKRIFERLGLGDITYKTFASGGVFSKYSHEFQTITDAGEDIIYIDEEKGIAVNKEVLIDEVLQDLGLEREKLVEKKATELGNIFNLGTKYSSALGLTYKDEKGEERPVCMGSYGIGPARVMGAIVEIFADEKGIVWPKDISPFDLYLIDINVKDESETLYKKLKEQGFDVLFDDRDTSFGEKINDFEILGIPFALVVSAKNLENNQYELIIRRNGEKRFLQEDELIDFLKEEYDKV